MTKNILLVEDNADDAELAVRAFRSGDTGQELHELKGHDGEVGWLALSPDGTMAVSSAIHNDFTLKVWDVVGGKAIQALRGHVRQVKGLAFAPDGARRARR